MNYWRKNLSVYQTDKQTNKRTNKQTILKAV